MGTRRYDHFENGIGYEFNSHTNWASVSLEELDRKITQANADFALLQSGQVQRVIWYGLEQLPTTGRAGELRRILEAARIDYIVPPR